MSLFTVDGPSAGLRVDRFLALKLEITRAQVKTLHDRGGVQVNDRAVKLHQILHEGDQIQVLSLPPRGQEYEMVPDPEVPFSIVHEDDEIVVVDKPSGVVMHPGSGVKSRTLVHGLLARTSLSSIGAPLRPGIVHRLDKETSGLLVVAKRDRAHLASMRQLKDRTLKRSLPTSRSSPRTDRSSRRPRRCLCAAFV